MSQIFGNKIVLKSKTIGEDLAMFDRLASNS